MELMITMIIFGVIYMTIVDKSAKREARRKQKQIDKGTNNGT